MFLSWQFFPLPVRLTLYQTTKKADLSKLRTFADNNLNVDQMMEFGFDRVENNMGKGENAQVTRIFSLSYNVFRRFLSQDR